jgi:1-acyl-sn-glycerol-3-phosphate acyltransferase
MLVANHPNALVDAMLVATTVERSVCITARATLFESPLLSFVLRRSGVIPLRRAQDVSTTTYPSPFLARNVRSRLHVTEAFRRGQAVLVFPEGTSHDGTHMVPLKSGAARLALQARNAEVRNLQILPIGLIYEAKDRVNTRVLVRVGVPIDVDAWCLGSATRSPAALTQEIASRLARAALDGSPCERARTVSGSTTTFAASQFLAALNHATLQDEPEFNLDPNGSEQAAQALHCAPLTTRRRVETFVDDVNTLGEQLESHGLKLEAQHGAIKPASALRWGIRHTLLLLLALLAVLGRGWTAILLYSARYIALRSLHDDESRDQPAMRTILVALGLLPLWCGMLVIAGALYAGLLNALLLLVTVVVASLVHAFYPVPQRRAARRVLAHFHHGAPEFFPTALQSRAMSLCIEAYALMSELQSGAD